MLYEILFKVTDNTNIGDTPSQNGTSMSLFQLEEENKQLKHYLHSTQHELSCARSDFFDLDSRFQHVESERVRLVKRVTALFSECKFALIFEFSNRNYYNRNHDNHDNQSSLTQSPTKFEQNKFFPLVSESA